MAEPMSGSSISPVFKSVDVAQVALHDAPIPSSWVLSGVPRARSGLIAHSPDGWASSVVWECTAGSFRWQFGWEETVVILEGAVRVTAETGEEKLLKPGDAAYFAQGTSSTWHVESYVKKIAFTRNRVPAYVRKPLVQVQRVRAGVRSLVQSVTQLNPVRKLMMAAVGAGGSIAFFGRVFEM